MSRVSAHCTTPTQKPSDFEAKKRHHKRDDITFDHGFVTGSRLDGEGPVLDVCLDAGVLELAPDQPLGVEDSVHGVHRNL